MQVKSFKAFKAFKRKGCKLYPLLTEVFGDPTFASRTSKEHRVESAGGEAGESEGTQSDNKKRKSGGDMLEMRRMKTSSGNDKYEAFLDVWKQSMMAFMETINDGLLEMRFLYMFYI